MQPWLHLLVQPCGTGCYRIATGEKVWFDLDLDLP
jgi:hypothetical protein